MTLLDEWRMKIRQTIGGSSAAAAVGRGRYKTRTQLWQEMVAARDGIVPPDRETDDMRRGRLLEHIAREQVAASLGVEIEPHPQYDLITAPHYPWAHALPDGWIGDDAIVELKVPRPATMARVAMHGLFPEWEIQALHNCAITGRQYCIIGMFDPVSTRVETCRVSADPHLIHELMRAEEDFYGMVVARRPPPPEASPAPDQAESLDAAHPVVLTTPEAQRAAENYVRLLRLVDDADELLAEARARLAVLSGCRRIGNRLIGGPDVFEVPGLLRVYHRVTRPHKVFQRELAIADYPALADERYWRYTDPPRPFRAYVLAEQGD